MFSGVRLSKSPGAIRLVWTSETMFKRTMRTVYKHWMRLEDSAFKESKIESYSSKSHKIIFKLKKLQGFEMDVARDAVSGKSLVGHFLRL
jgi:hypothetical protein